MPPTNYVAEWFGHIVWPPDQVDASVAAANNQTTENCPFLEHALRTPTRCVKTAGQGTDAFRTGFCTQSSESNGQAEDWLACPNRILGNDQYLIKDAIRNVFGLPVTIGLEILPITRLRVSATNGELHSYLNDPKKRVFTFSMNPPGLGGEIDIPGTAHSPASKVDVTVAELTVINQHGLPTFGNSAIIELQTADFHGSPLHAIGRLRSLGPPTSHGEYHSAIRASPLAMAERLEGPNKATIFKRTIYQILVKIRMSQAAGVGFCVLLPEPVWTSWAAHLGSPGLAATDAPGVSRLVYARVHQPGSADPPAPAPSAWIVVFRVDRTSTESPRPLVVSARIATSAEELSELAFVVAPALGVRDGALGLYETAFRERVRRHW